MKKAFAFSLFGLITTSLTSCSSVSNKDSERKPASIREVSSFLNKEITQKKNSRPKIKFLSEMKNSPTTFTKNTGINVETNKNHRSFASDVNKDGKIDLVSINHNSGKKLLKIDRDYDGKFDRFEKLDGDKRQVKYDDDFDGKIDKVVTSSMVSATEMQRSVFDVKSKKKVSYVLVVSNRAGSHTEGRVCGDCETEFRDAVRDLRSQEAKDAQTEEWYDKVFFEDVDVYETIEGFKNTYLKVEPTLLFSESCAHMGKKFAYLISDSINDYFDCFKKFRNNNSQIKAQNATALLQGVVSSLTDKDRPLKIHCVESSDHGEAWAIPNSSTENPTEIPAKDASFSLVFNSKKLEGKSKDQLKHIVMHEFTHLFTGAHGEGTDRASSCPSLCLNKSPVEDSIKLRDIDWESSKNAFENVCLGGPEVSESASTNLNEEDYSYLKDVFKVFEINGGSSYGDTELGNQIIKEIAHAANSGKLPIQKLTLEERKDLAVRYLRSQRGFKKSEALRTVESFKSLNLSIKGDFDYLPLVMPALILEDKPMTKKRISELYDFALKNYGSPKSSLARSLGRIYKAIP